MLWDIFCKVIDNYGDIGVCWRLACNLASRGQPVRLWVDDASALAWMAPQGCAGVEVRPWTQPLDLANITPGDVLVEAFGCEIAPDFIAYYAQSIRVGGQNGQSTQPNRHWINLEYLTAEPFAQRNHALPSPVLAGPGTGLTKHFFYPGFTVGTGGLLREDNLARRQAAFDRQAWLHRLGLADDTTQVVSLFCYEPAALGGLLHQLALGPRPTRLLVTPGRATEAVKNAFNAGLSGNIDPKPLPDMHGQLSVSYLPPLSQDGFDELLWAADLNFVRGEDSLVRALWAGKPFIWHIYPQHDGAHAAKLEAFLDWLDADASLRQFHRVWNGLAPGPLPAPDLPAWCPIARAAREKLQQQADLATQLLNFVTPQPQGAPKKR